MASNTRSHHNPVGEPARPLSKLAAQVQACATALHDLIAALDPRDVPLTWAPDVLAAFASAERAATSGRLLMTARAAEAGQWQRERCGSPAEWLAEQFGTTPGRARADLETSERLGELDASADAVRAGELSPEQAEAVTDAATVNPDAEEDLLEVARRESLRRMRAEAERRKAEARSEAERAERDRRVRRERRVRFWYRNGAGHLDAVGPIADIAQLEQWLNTQIDRHLRTQPDPGPGRREPITAHRFDALVGITNHESSENEPAHTQRPARGSGHATGAGNHPAGQSGRDDASSETNDATDRSANEGSPHTSGDGSTTGPNNTADTPPTRPRARPSISPRRLTFIRVDLAALIRGRAGPGELCEIGGLPISIAEARRLLGDSILQLVLTNGDAVIDVVNLHRKPTLAQKLALLFSDASCRVAGCDRTVCLEFDHRNNWADVLTTELANLDPLCDHHHELKTLENWQLTPGTGRRPMVPPTNPRHPSHSQQTNLTNHASLIEAG